MTIQQDIHLANFFTHGIQLFISIFVIWAIIMLFKTNKHIREAEKRGIAVEMYGFIKDDNLVIDREKLTKDELGKFIEDILKISIERNISLNSMLKEIIKSKNLKNIYCKDKSFNLNYLENMEFKNYNRLREIDRDKLLVSFRIVWNRFNEGGRRSLLNMFDKISLHDDLAVFFNHTSGEYIMHTLSQQYLW